MLIDLLGGVLGKLPIVGPVVSEVLSGQRVATTAEPGETVPQPAGVEAKVAACTDGAALGALAATLLRPLLGRLPAPFGMLVNALLPAVLSALLGWLAPHTPRA